MDLLLTHGYFLHEDPKELQIMKPHPPLGILYLCSYVRAKGFGVEVFDSTFSSREELFALLHTTLPTVLGVYSNLGTRPNVVEIVKAAKEAGWQTMVGGPEPAAYIEEYLDAGADVVVIGEGEVTLEELLPALASVRTGHATRAQALASVHGIAFRGEDRLTHRTPARALIPRLDEQPWPAREAIDAGRYVETWRKHHGMAAISLIAARGCPYHCHWCSHEDVFGKTHRRRSPAATVDELEWLLHRYQADTAWFADDVFTILWAVYASGSAPRIKTVTVLGTYAVVGRYARAREIPIIRAVLSAERAASLDWTTVVSADPRSLLDVWWVEGELGG